MKGFMKEIAICDTYYENAEMTAMTSFFLEAADDSVEDKEDPKIIKQIGEKVKKVIDDLIQAIKDFAEAIKRRFEDRKVMESLKKIRKSEMKALAADINDKQAVKLADAILKLEEAAIKKYMSAYEMYMAHKIDYAKFIEMVDEISDSFDKKQHDIQLQAQDLELFKKNDRASVIKCDVVATRLQNVVAYQEKACDKIMKDAVAAEQKLQAAARAKVKEASESAAATKIGQKISMTHRKAVAAIVAVLGILVAVGGAAAAYHVGSSKAASKASDDTDANESADFAEFIGSVFEESAADPAEFDTSFDDIDFDI